MFGKNKNETMKIKKRKGIKRITFNIKYGLIKKRIEPEEFQLAGEYLQADIDKFTTEKDLLLRGLDYKSVKRIIDAYEYLLWLSNIPEPQPLIEKKLKGGILDGIRRS